MLIGAVPYGSGTLGGMLDDSGSGEVIRTIKFTSTVAEALEFYGD